MVGEDGAEELASPPQKIIEVLQSGRGEPSPLVGEYLRRDLLATREWLMQTDQNVVRQDLVDALSDWAQRTDADELAGQALMQAGELSMDAGDLDAACEYWERALQRSPVESGAIGRMEAALSEHHDWEKLEAAWLSQLQALSNRTPWEINLQVQALCRLGDLRANQLRDVETAILAYRQALEIDRAGRVLTALAHLYLRRGQPDDSHDAAELFVELSHQATPQDARTLLERALDVQPDHEGAMTALHGLLSAQDSTEDPHLTARMHRYIQEAAASPFRDKIAKQLGEEEPEPELTIAPHLVAPNTAARAPQAEDDTIRTPVSTGTMAPAEQGREANLHQVSEAPYVDSLSPLETGTFSSPLASPARVTRLWAVAMGGMAIVAGVAVYSLSLVPSQAPLRSAAIPWQDQAPAADEGADLAALRAESSGSTEQAGAEVPASPRGAGEPPSEASTEPTRPGADKEQDATEPSEASVTPKPGRKPSLFGRKHIHDRSGLRRVLAQVNTEVETCYAALPAPAPAGALQYRVHVNANGEASEIVLKVDRLKAESVQDCAKRALEQATYPKPSAKTGSFQVTFKLAR